MRIALVTDLHFGARNDNKRIAEHQQRFFEEVFFPYIDEHNITTVVDLGDTFDRRKFINFDSLGSCREFFFKPMAERNIDLHILVGNHDSYFKNTIDLNSIDLLTGEFENVITYSKPVEINIDGCPIVMVPWICKDNADEVYDMVEKTKAQVLFGHLELAGYQMYKGMAINHGMSDEWLAKFSLVCSGHYHTRSTTGCVNYLGVAYEMTWSDYDDPKGFHIFDTHTRELEFIQNPNRIFRKIKYDDTKDDIKAMLDWDLSEYEGCYVKVIVINKSNPYWFDTFMEKLERAEPIHVQVVDDNLNLDMEDDNDIIEEAEDTLTILNNYVEQLDGIVDRDGVSALIHDLYREALTVS